MYTLYTLCLLYSIFGWILRAKNSAAGQYKFNPFDEFPTAGSMALIICTAVAGVGTILMIVMHCP